MYDTTSRKRKNHSPCSSQQKTAVISPELNRGKKMLYVCDWLHHKYPQLSLREIATLTGTPYSTVQYNVKKAEKISSHLLEKRCSPVSLPPHMKPKLEQADWIS